MPSPSALNSRETAEFDADIVDVFESARDGQALDFAAQFDETPSASPAAATAAQPFKMTVEDMGKNSVAQGNAATETSLAAGRDIGLGIMHGPRSALRGASKGINNMISFVDELNDWIPMPSVIDPETGKFNPGFRSENEIENAKGFEIGSPQLPVPDENKTPTVTGSLIEGIAQFATGLKGAGAVIKSAGAIGAAGRGVLGDMLSFDAHDERLSNIVQQVPALQNPVTDYLEADDADGTVEAKFKQAVEGLLGNSVADGLVQGVKFLKKGKVAASDLVTEGKSLDDLFDVPAEEAAGVGLEKKQFDFLGDGDNDFYLIPDDGASTATVHPDKIEIAANETKGIDGDELQSVRRDMPDMLDVQTDVKVGEFSRRILSDNKRTEVLSLGKIPDAAASWLNNMIAKYRPKTNSPLDVSGFEHVITDDGIRHAWKNHGPSERNPKNVPLAEADFDLIPKIIAQPDKVEVYARSTEKPASIVYSKTFEDGTTDVVEMVHNKAGRLGFKTMYKIKRQEGASMSADADPKTSRPESGSASQRPERPPGEDNIANKPYKINYARIQGPEDIKNLMDEMVNRPELRASIEAERRGVRDVRTTLTAATDIDGFDELMSRRTGDAFNAETIVAARKVYYDTTTKLMEAAKRAAAAEASPIDQFSFRKMLAVHHAVQKEFMGVRAEAGRALQAWSIPVGGTGGENVRALEQLLNEFGGSDVSQALARKLAALGNNLNTTQINAITQKSASARTVDAISEAWTLGLLTNPTTHVVNISSNVLTSLVLGAERLGMAAAKDSPVTLREGGEFFVALLEAQKGAIKNAAQAFRTGQTGIGISKLDLPRTRATARDILDPDGQAGLFSKALDGWGAILSKYAGGALTAGDEYSKTVLYQAQVRSLAVREGIALGLEGPALKTHVAEMLAAPSENLRADAVTFANYGTFTKELGAIGQSVQRAIAKQPLLRFVVPFVRTPANIFKFTFERTPLAPLSEKVRADIKAGGARRAAAMTKIGMGTSIMAIGADLSQNGVITGTGPTDPDIKAGLRRTGWQPHSLKIGETYYSYARFEPIATVLGLAADISEILSNYEAYDIDAQNEADELVTAAAIAAGNQVVGKTFLNGMADLMEMLSDPGRYGEKYLAKFAGSFVPAGSAAIERAINPAMEEVFSMTDAVRSRIPGASGSVTKRRNIWGDEIKYFYPEEKNIVGASAQRMLSLFNPIYASSEKDAPVDKWMLENGFDIGMPNKRQVFEGVPLDLRENPKAYERLVQMRGSEIELQKYGNQSMKKFFENLASEDDPFGRHIGFFMAIGNDFDDQQNFINQVVSDYNSAAKDALLEEFPELEDTIRKERSAAERLKTARPPIPNLQNKETQ